MQVPGPSNLTAPCGMVAIQAQLAPPAGSAPSSYTIMPQHLVFGRKRVLRTSLPHYVEADVMDAWTNVHNTTWDDVRCLGISMSYMQSSATLMTASPGCGRFSVAVTGVVNLACNRALLTTALPGDIVYWRKEAAAIAYIGGPQDHRSAVIECVHPATGSATAEKCGNDAGVQATLAHDPITLAHLLVPTKEAYTLEEARAIVAAKAAIGGRVGRLLALGPEGTNEMRVLLDL